MEKDPFSKYILESELSKKDKAYSWYTSIGLQDVDGLKTSKYLNELAIKNIEGEITLEDAESLIYKYYEEKNDDDCDTEEADKVSANIVKVLADKSFIFSPQQYIDIHRQLFSKIFDHAGKIRTKNISKKEWVLNGDTVIYGGINLIEETLRYEFNEEKLFDYSNLDKNQFVKHMARFISNVWQIHAFREGNTRTTAVFLIKYLNKFGYSVSNNTFAINAWYFRNALVRANYSNFEKGVFETTEYLELFLKNLLFNETNELKNRHMHIDWKKNVVLLKDSTAISNALYKKYSRLYPVLVNEEYFGRTEVVNILNMSERGASKLIANLLAHDLIVAVSGHGKGKYKFNI